MKVGTRVKFARRNGEVVTGKTKGKPYALGNGTWVEVILDGSPKGAKPAKVRPSELTAIG